MNQEEQELAMFGIFNGGVWRYSDTEYDLYVNVSESKFFFTFFQHLKNDSGVHLYHFLKDEIPELVYDIFTKEHISFDMLETFVNMEHSWSNIKNNIEKSH